MNPTTGRRKIDPQEREISLLKGMLQFEKERANGLAKDLEIEMAEVLIRGRTILTLKERLEEVTGRFDQCCKNYKELAVKLLNENHPDVLARRDDWIIVNENFEEIERVLGVGIEFIDVGAHEGDCKGDTLREAASKVNRNMIKINNALGAAHTVKSFYRHGRA